MHRLHESAIRGLLHDQRGNIAMLFALMLGVLFAFGALAIDAGNLYVTKSKLRGAANAAALAAVSQFPDESAARALALDYATKNMPEAANGSVLVESDVEFGHWDYPTRTFTSGASPANAVMVTTRRSAANGNPVGTYFASLMGYEEVDVDTTAVARAASPPICMLALEPMEASSFDVGNGTVTANACHPHQLRRQRSDGRRTERRGDERVDLRCRRL